MNSVTDRTQNTNERTFGFDEESISEKDHKDNKFTDPDEMLHDNS